MKKLVYTLIFLTTSTFIFYGQEKEKIISQMVEEVSFLASDKLEGRETGSLGEKTAANYIKEKFISYNLSPKGDNDSYYQYFKASVRKNPHSNEIKKKITGINVVGFKNNNAKETIIIGAHYDHIGYGSFGSLYSGEKQVHNGADDNASGVSIMLNLAYSLMLDTNYNYLFIALSGEEHGLYGSSYYAKNPTINLNNVRFMINFDMVGRLNQENILAINGIGTSSHWKKLIQDANNYNFDLKTTESGIGPSDHTSFYLQDIPSIHFFTGQHSDYHKPSDDVEKINFEGMYKIHNYVKEIILNSISITDFDFQKTASNESKSPKFNVTLGVMPDYLFDGIGMRIDGISKGKTAEKYGIQKGDIVLAIGNNEVTDMTSYMQGLSKFNKGDKTTISIKREDSMIKIDIIFQ